MLSSGKPSRTGIKIWLRMSKESVKRNMVQFNISKLKGTPRWVEKLWQGGYKTLMGCRRAKYTFNLTESIPPRRLSKAWMVAGSVGGKSVLRSSRMRSCRLTGEGVQTFMSNLTNQLCKRSLGFSSIIREVRWFSESCSPRAPSPVGIYHAFRGMSLCSWLQIPFVDTHDFSVGVES